MADELPVEVPEDVPVAVPGDAPMSARDAARALASVRWSKPAEQPPDPMPVDLSTVPESGEEAAPETDPGEPQQTQQTAEPVEEELPPIEPPRSWSKAWKEEFQNYPREAQEKIAAREQERETALRRGQNEASELRKAIDAERTTMEQTRKQYEEILPQLTAMLQQQQMGEFSDIKSMADVEKMAREDWPRFSAYQAHQMKLQAVQQQMQAAQQRQQQDYQTKWTKFATDEDAKFIEAAPEMADSERAGKVRDASISLLHDIGFSDDDLNKLWNGQASLSLRDHRAQLLIRDAMRYREAKAAVPKAAVKPVPKVQRPGSPAARAPDSDARERNIINNLEGMRGMAAARLGAQLIAERRSRSR